MTDPFDHEVDELLAHRAAHATPSSDARRRIDAKIARRSRTRRLAAGLGAVAVVALVVGAGLVWQRGGDGNDASTVEFVDETHADHPTRLVDAATELSFQLGREEVLSAAVLGEGGEAFRAQLDEQRTATDRAAEAMLALAPGPPSLPSSCIDDSGLDDPELAGPEPPATACPDGSVLPLRLDDLGTVRQAIDGDALPWNTLIDQFGHIRDAAVDEARAGTATVGDVARFRALEQALWFAQGSGSAADAAAVVAVHLGLSPADRATNGVGGGQGCTVRGLAGPCTLDAIESHVAASDSAFDEWARRAAPDAATTLDDQLAWLGLRTAIDAIRAAAVSPEAPEPIIGLNTTWVPGALQGLDRLHELGRSIADQHGGGPTVPTDTTLTSVEVTDVALDLLVELGHLGMEPGSDLRLSAAPDALTPLADLVDRARSEDAPADVVVALENAELAFNVPIDTSADDLFAYRLEVLVDLVHAAGQLAPDAAALLTVEQTGRLGEGYARLALQNALLTTVVTSNGQAWPTNDRFDRFLDAGVDGDQAIADWDERASSDLRATFRNEIAVAPVRAADEVVTEAIVRGPMRPVDTDPAGWLDAGRAKLDALARVLRIQAAEIPS